jgi:hypothetical protein
MGRGLGSSEEVWQRQTNVGCDTLVHGSSARTLSVYLSLAQTSKNAESFLLSVMLSLQQNWIQEGRTSSAPR